MKEIDTLYDVMNFEATCFFNEKEPEAHWHLRFQSIEISKQSQWLPNRKDTKNAGRGQFDALTQGLEICDESRGLDNFPKFH